MKIKNLVPVKIKHTIKDFIRDTAVFGINVAICHAGYNYFSYSIKSKQFLAWNERRKKSIMDFLEKELHDLVLEYQKKSDQSVITEGKAPVWVFWWQGENTMPPIIQLCLESKKTNAGEHPVYVLDEHNYQDYIFLRHLCKKKYRLLIFQILFEALCWHSMEGYGLMLLYSVIDRYRSHALSVTSIL